MKEKKKISIVIDKSKISKLLIKVLVAMFLSFLTLCFYYYPTDQHPVNIIYLREQLIKDKIQIESRLFNNEDYHITLYGIHSRENFANQVYYWNNSQRDILTKEKLVDNFGLLNVETQDSLQRIEDSKTVEIDVDPVFQAIIDSMSALPKTDNDLAEIEKNKQKRMSIDNFEYSYAEEIKSLFDQYKNQINYSSIKNQGTYIDLEEQVTASKVFIVFILPMIFTFKYMYLLAIALFYTGLIYLIIYLKENISIRFK